MEVRLLPSNSKSNVVVHPAQLDFGPEDEGETPADESPMPMDENINDELAEAAITYDDEAEIYPLPIIEAEPHEEESLDDLIAGVPTEEEARPRNPEPIVYAAWYPAIHQEDDTEPELAPVEDDHQPAAVLLAEDDEYRLAPTDEPQPALGPSLAELRPQPRERLLAWDGPKAWWVE
jgi:hypothetical protein